MWRSAIYWLRTLHRRLHVVWSFPGSTIVQSATLCSMALHSTPSTSSNDCRTTSHESFIKRQDDHLSLAAEAAHWLPVKQRISYKLVAGRADVQDTANVNTGVSQSPHPGTRWHSITAIIGRSVPRCALQTVCLSVKRSFSYVAATTCNSPPPSVINCDYLSLCLNLG